MHPFLLFIDRKCNLDLCFYPCSSSHHKLLSFSSVTLLTMYGIHLTLYKPHFKRSKRISISALQRSFEHSFFLQSLRVDNEKLNRQVQDQFARPKVQHLKKDVTPTSPTEPLVPNQVFYGTSLLLTSHFEA